MIRVTFNYQQTFFISSKNCIFLITFWFKRFDFTFPDRSSPNDKKQGKKGGSHKRILLYFGNQDIIIKTSLSFLIVNLTSLQQTSQILATHLIVRLFLDWKSSLKDSLFSFNLSPKSDTLFWGEIFPNESVVMSNLHLVMVCLSAVLEVCNI